MIAGDIPSIRFLKAQTISTKTAYWGDTDAKGLLDLVPEARDVRGAAALFFV